MVALYDLPVPLPNMDFCNHWWLNDFPKISSERHLSVIKTTSARNSSKFNSTNRTVFTKCRVYCWSSLCWWPHTDCCPVVFRILHAPLTQCKSWNRLPVCNLRRVFQIPAWTKVWFNHKHINDQKPGLTTTTFKMHYLHSTKTVEIIQHRRKANEKGKNLQAPLRIETL